MKIITELCGAIVAVAILLRDACKRTLRRYRWWRESKLKMLRRLWIRLLWAAGIKGPSCECGFHEASHDNPSLEFDMESYPCKQFRRKA